MIVQDRDYRDLVAGLLLGGLGLFMVLYSAAHYALGTFAHMRPGMFPTLLGYLLILLGTLIMVPAALRIRRRRTPDVEGVLPLALRPLAAVIASIAAFALLIPYFGMVPAIFALTAIAALGDSRLGLFGILVLGTALSMLTVAIFSYGLGIALAIARWPF